MRSPFFFLSLTAAKESQDDELMKEVSHFEEVIDLPGDDSLARRAEERYFKDFFNQGREIAEGEGINPPPQEELKRKLGRLAATDPNEMKRLLEESDEAGDAGIEGGMERSSRKEPGGFEKRGRRQQDGPGDAVLSSATKAKERQRTIRRDMQDRMCVGDVVVPEKFHDWILNPTGDHSKRHRRQREKEERIQRWIEEHGMYRKAKKESSFRRDPVFEDLTIRQRRVAMLINEALDQVFLHDFQHVKVPAFTIDDIKVTTDLKNVRVQWNAIDEAAVIQKFFWKQGAAIRHHVTERVNLKFSPILHFVHSDVMNKDREIDRMLYEEEQTLAKASGAAAKQ